MARSSTCADGPQNAPVILMVPGVQSPSNALGISRFTFAGHSMSGAMGWRYALAHPERVEALILVSAGGFVAEGGGPILPFRILASPIEGSLARINTGEGQWAASIKCVNPSSPYL
jgi:pimeloyl-ACP methyl ester carboxylesterase